MVGRFTQLLKLLEILIFYLESYFLEPLFEYRYKAANEHENYLSIRLDILFLRKFSIRISSWSRLDQGECESLILR
jgi:hypothetical protein